MAHTRSRSRSGTVSGTGRPSGSRRAPRLPRPSAGAGPDSGPCRAPRFRPRASRCHPAAEPRPLPTAAPGGPAGSRWPGRAARTNEDDHTIVAAYGAEYRGIVQYYLLAGNVARLYRLHWVMETSLLKTLADKHRSSVTKMARKHKAAIDTPHGPRKCVEATIERNSRKPLVARFGGIPLRRQKDAVIDDRPAVLAASRHKELVTRLLAGRCELCGDTGRAEVHQVRKLADLGKPGQPRPIWAELMARRRRKTLVVCPSCHQTIHGQPPPLLAS